MLDLLFDVELIVDATFECEYRAPIRLSDADDRGCLAEMIVRVYRVLLEFTADKLSAGRFKFSLEIVATIVI